MIDITKEITNAVREYTNEVKEGIQEAQKDVSKETAMDLKRTSPKGDYKGGGAYAKGWRAKKTKRGYVVHNATKYQLTHLLEKGHAKRGGGRVPAYPHIGPAEDRAIDEYEKRVEKVIRG
ncbi:HK97 gp10 family phage protein [Virgibacillus salexigens]|uniref:HK97 gp10 family phage protein n=1 Tax=Virgibacillus kapii TaxID=1638645 RepID=A0ABQ2DLR6_9BACI|nr:MULTISPECIES: HK97 gp10 family phage protein [Virgibacillus]GGJ61997.1 hypothetical protein GCM10007111_25130 [Virgibacillus kapii]